MFLVSSCSCLCAKHGSQLLSREWRCSWSSADRRCSNYIWVMKQFHYILRCDLYMRFDGNFVPGVQLTVSQHWALILVTAGYTHIPMNWVIIRSGNGLATGRHQAITWSSELLSVGTNFSKIWTKKQWFSFWENAFEFENVWKLWGH